MCVCACVHVFVCVHACACVFIFSNACIFFYIETQKPSLLKHCPRINFRAAVLAVIYSVLFCEILMYGLHTAAKYSSYNKYAKC